MIGHNGIVKASAHDNLVLAYKDSYSKIKNFEWYDWDSFLKTKFTACTGIHSWHVVKVKKELDHLEVAKFVGEPFETYYNQTQQAELGSFPQILNPQDLSEQRKVQLQYFEPYIDQVHRDYIPPDY